MSQNARLAAMDARIVRAFSRSGLADGPTASEPKRVTFHRKLTATDIPCTVLFDDAVQLVGDQTQVVDGKKAITAYFVDIGTQEPVHGDAFTISGVKWSVDSISNRDASRVICIVSEKK